VGADVDRHRGHSISELGGVWVYDADGVPVASDPERACGACGLDNTPDGHDGCLGQLPGVMNACCGHGRSSDAYVQLPDRTVVSGEESISLITRLRSEGLRAPEIGKTPSP